MAEALTVSSPAPDGEPAGGRTSRPTKSARTMTHLAAHARQRCPGWKLAGEQSQPSAAGVRIISGDDASGPGVYPSPDVGREVSEGKPPRRARQWLLAAQPASTEERGMRRGSHCGRMHRVGCRPRSGEIRAQRDANGSWSRRFARTAETPTHGRTVSARTRCTWRACRRAMQRTQGGDAFLLGTRSWNGRPWLVKTHSFPIRRISAVSVWQTSMDHRRRPGWSFHLAISTGLPTDPLAVDTGRRQLRPPQLELAAIWFDKVCDTTRG